MAERQTRYFEGVVNNSSYGFKSHRPHQQYISVSRDIRETLFLIVAEKRGMCRNAFSGYFRQGAPVRTAGRLRGKRKGFKRYAAGLAAVSGRRLPQGRSSGSGGVSSVTSQGRGRIAFDDQGAEAAI